MDKFLVVGASGATGRLLVEILLKKNRQVIAIVRKTQSLSHLTDYQSNLSIIEAELSRLTSSDLAPYLKECSSVLSCLGHNLTFQGMFGQPRRLVTDAIRIITQGIELNGLKRVTKVILMNTTGNSNRDIPENPPLSQRVVIGILRHLLPPHVDNEEAADYLRVNVGNNHQNIEWVAVRPDSLIDKDSISGYDIYPSPIRNAIFDAGSTSRINVAEFMSELALDSELWNKWKGQMPVIYDHV